jgi:hypothetical protein
MFRAAPWAKGDGFRCAQPILRAGIVRAWILRAGIVSLAWSVVGLGSSAHAQAERDPLQLIRQQPMTFVVAKGDPGACGPGCSEWIAAEGGFDQAVHVRFREFLNALPRKDLPIFFHSFGGLIGPALGVGSLLRAHRMTAGVGHTIPFGCRDTLKLDEACRKLMQLGRDFQSRLRESGAICASSCVYAFVGASTRAVSYVARVGVHRHRALRKDGDGLWSGADGPAGGVMVIDRLKQYVTQMGVDFGLIDAAEQTVSTHWLSRDELARYGVTTGGLFETRWMTLTRPDVGYFVSKSATRPSRVAPAEYRTATIEFRCSFLLNGLSSVSLRRDLDPAEAQDGVTVQVLAGERVILHSARPSASTFDLRATSIAPAMIAKVAASDYILLKETGEGWSRETQFSTAGLSDALKFAPEECRAKD